MRIILVSHSPHLQGAERMILNFVRLFKNDHRIDIIVLIPSAGQGKLASELDAERVTWYEIPPAQWFIQVETKDWNKFLSDAYRRSYYLADLISELKADLVIVNTLTSIDFALAAIRSERPIVLWAHGLIESWWIGQDSQVRRFCEQMLISVAQKVICVSEHTKKYFEACLPNENYRTIHNWTDVKTEVDTYRRGRNFVCLATFEGHKGVRTVLEAAAVAKKRSNIDFTIDLYGDDSEGVISKLAIELNIHEVVSVYPRTSDIDEVYKGAYTVVVPSFVESFGMVAIESMSRGTAVIASDAGGLPEVIEHGVSGLLFASGDANQLADRMVQILSDEFLARRIGSAGYTRARELFDGGRARRAWLETANEVVGCFKGHNSQSSLVIQFAEMVSESLSSSKTVIIKRSPQIASIAQSAHNSVPAFVPADRASSVVGESNLLLQNEPSTSVGHFDGLIDGTYLHGWAFSPVTPGPCELGIFIDNRLSFRLTANEERSDLSTIGIRDVFRGFKVPIPAVYLDGDEHVFSVIILENGQQLSGSPRALRTKKMNSIPEFPRKKTNPLRLNFFRGGMRPNASRHVYFIRGRNKIMGKMLTVIFRLRKSS